MIIWGFDRGREPLNVEEFSYEKVDSLDKEEEVISEDNVEELVLEEEDNGDVSEGVISINKNIGSRIYGDFNGDGKKEYAYRKLVKEGYGGSRVDGGVPEEYEIQFSDSSIKPIAVGCCWFTLINKGDLDNDGADEIIIVQDPHNGCLGRVQTYTIKNNESRYLFDPFYLFICDGVSDENMFGLIVKEGSKVYYYEVDLNDLKLLKKEAVFY